MKQITRVALTVALKEGEMPPYTINSVAEIDGRRFMVCDIDCAWGAMGHECTVTLKPLKEYPIFTLTSL
jgi:hypothetical protein